MLSSQLCQPSSLSSIQKADWSRVGCLVLEAIREVSKHYSVPLWLKVLCREAGEDLETAWRENPFFPLQNSIPEVNRVVLLELVKSMAAVYIFASLLLCLPPFQLCTELERLTEHVESSPVREEDGQFFTGGVCRPMTCYTPFFIH
uniref:Uncharacterized protein n=1 Tax=Sphaeramia orbicularis TaxID=375764 RepID=A0A672Z1D5_9TELE